MHNWLRESFAVIKCSIANLVVRCKEHGYGDRHLELGSLYREELESDSRSAEYLGATVPILFMVAQ